MRILIVDDHEVVRRGVRSLLSGRAGYEVCGDAVDGQDALEKARELEPDLIVMDVSMPRLNGLEATRQVRSMLPDCEVLIVSQHENSEMARQALRAGARGYVVKSSISQNLISAIDKASRREYFFDPAILDKTPSTHTDVQEILLRSAAFEEALLESEERYRGLISATAEIVWRTDPEGRLVWMSPKWFELSGQTEGTASGWGWLGAVHPEDRDRIRCAWEDAVRAKTTYRVEWRMLLRDGSSCDFETRAAPIRDKQGNIREWAGVVFDITEQKKTENDRKLIEAELEAEANALAKLNACSSRVWRMRTLQDGLDEILSSSIELLGADKGNIQLLNPHRAVLTIAVQRGFEQEFLEFFREVSTKDDSACGRALRDRQRIVIEDVQNDVAYAPYRNAAQAAGYRAVISSPLTGLDGTPLGILSVHFRTPHRPSYQDLQRLDLYVAQASDFIQRCKMDEQLKRSEEQFRSLTASLDSEVCARTRELETKNSDLLKQSEQVRELSQRLLQAEDDERRHIARELHDSAGQTLAVLCMNVPQFARQAERISPELATRAAEIEALIQQLNREVRTTSYLLHPPLLDESGLSSALNGYVEGLAERSEVAITLDIADNFGRLPSDMELLIFRLVQECLTNVHRHSESKTAQIRVARDSANIRVEVRDTGKGMPPERLESVQSGTAGVGITGMRERLRQFRGTMKIESSNSGTSVAVNIPVSEKARSPDVARLQTAV